MRISLLSLNKLLVKSRNDWLEIARKHNDISGVSKNIEFWNTAILAPQCSDQLIKIVTTSHYDISHVINNQDLHQSLDNNDKWGSYESL